MTTTPGLDPANRDALFAEGVALRVKAIDAHRGGHLHRALDLYLESERRFHRAELPMQVAWSMLGQGQVQEQLGEPTQAVALFTGAEAMFRYHGDKAGIPLCFRRRGDVLRRQGRQDAALAQYCEGEAIYRTFCDPLGIVATLACKAMSYLAMGRRIEGHAALAEALWKLQEQPPQHGETDFLIHALSARVAGLNGDADAARAHLAQAVRIADLCGLREDHSNPDVIAECRSLPAATPARPDPDDPE
jgi:tetratricopeptide (TPR) repeat protein